MHALFDASEIVERLQKRLQIQILKNLGRGHIPLPRPPQGEGTPPPNLTPLQLLGPGEFVP